MSSVPKPLSIQRCCALPHSEGDDLSEPRDSDVDLLVDMDPDRSLLDIVGVGQDLEELLDRRVDVLTGASLHPGLHDRILAESRPL